jgi:hypothetical protein
LRLVAGGWFVLREKYCWLVADEPSEQAVHADPSAIEVAKDWAQLRTVVMIAKNCMHDRRVN